MSLLRPIVRTCVVAALRDRTWCEDRVYDTDQRPLAQAVLGAAVPKPYCTVFTDGDDRPVVFGAELYNDINDTRQLNITIEIGVASAIKGTDNNVTINFSSNDQGMEWAVDVVEMQIKEALISDPQSEWGELLKKFANRFRRVTSRRGGQNQSGVRFNARRLVFTCSTIDDIVPGRVLSETHPVRQFITMARDNPQVGIVDAATIVESLLDTSATEAPNWRIAQAQMGLTKEAVEALNPRGVPLPWPYNEEPPLDYSDTNEWVPGLEVITIQDSDRDASVDVEEDDS